MASVYESPFLKIEKEGDTLVQKWTDKPLSAEKFKEEILEFSSIADIEKPVSLIWLHENFKLEIPPKLYDWLETNITQKHYRQGLRNVAFSVPSSMKAHLSVINSFNQTQSVIQPAYFTSEFEARNYIEDLNKSFAILNTELDYSVDYQEKGKVNIHLNLDLNELPNIMTAFLRIEKNKELALSKIEAYQSLTIREQEVMRLIAKGHTNVQVSQILCISEHTAKNHRKHIINKLEISNTFELFQYAQAFGLIL